MSMKKITKAVIPAAGLGTRFLPATKAQPKEMLPIVDKPAIQYVVEEAVRAGIDDILIITGRSKRSLEDHFDRNFELEYFLEDRGKTSDLAEVRRLAELADIHYVRQGEPLGLGHAVSVARKHVGDEPFVVMLGDDIMDEEIRWVLFGDGDDARAWFQRKRKQKQHLDNVDANQLKARLKAGEVFTRKVSAIHSLSLYA
jgi:UTP--glucose-1-phosphate uridylyltransferase